MGEVIGYLVGIAIVLVAAFYVVRAIVLAIWYTAMAIGGTAIFLFEVPARGLAEIFGGGVADPVWTWALFGLLVGGLIGTGIGLQRLGRSAHASAAFVGAGVVYFLLLCVGMNSLDEHLPSGRIRPPGASGPVAIDLAAVPKLWQGTAQGGGDGTLTLRLTGISSNQTFEARFYWKVKQGNNATQLMHGTLNPATGAISLDPAKILRATENRWTPDTLKGKLEAPQQGGRWRMSGEGFSGGRKWGTWRMTPQAEASSGAPAGNQSLAGRVARTLHGMADASRSQSVDGFMAWVSRSNPHRTSIRSEIGQTLGSGQVWSYDLRSVHHETSNGSHVTARFVCKTKLPGGLTLQGEHSYELILEAGKYKLHGPLFEW